MSTRAQQILARRRLTWMAALYRARRDHKRYVMAAAVAFAVCAVAAVVAWYSDPLSLIVWDARIAIAARIIASMCIGVGLVAAYAARMERREVQRLSQWLHETEEAAMAEYFDTPDEPGGLPPLDYPDAPSQPAHGTRDIRDGAASSTREAKPTKESDS